MQHASQLCHSIYPDNTQTRTRTHTPTIEEIASCNPGTTYRPLPEVLFPDIVRLMRGMPERRVLRQTRYFVSSETRPEDNGRRRRSHKSLSSSTREEPLNAFRGSLGCACRATPVCPRPPSPARVPTAAPKHNTPSPRPPSLPRIGLRRRQTARIASQPFRYHLPSAVTSG